MKRKILTFTALLLCIAVWGQRTQLSLSGVWKTGLGDCYLPGTTDESRLGEKNTDTLQTSRLSRLYSFTGKMAYEKDIVIPKEMAGKKLMLVMERTKPSTFWFDADSIGHQTNIYTAHKYVFGPVSSGLHHITIIIDNTLDEVPKGLPSSHAYSENTQTNWNGIIGDFHIEALPDPYIEEIRTYPSVSGHSVRIVAKIHSAKERKARLKTDINSFNTEQSSPKISSLLPITLSEGSQEIEQTLDLGASPLLWSEFHPALYSANLTLEKDSQSATFGMRDLKVSGNRILLNGKKIFLRGKHDALVFPLTGYPPMDIDSWIKVFRKAKEYGINHYRFHSCTPPKAAFDAADIVGIYIQAELPMWGKVNAADTEVVEFMLSHGESLLDYVGNSPSFMFLGLGNELGGDVDEMRRWLSVFRAKDSRQLYDFGANNFLGWKGQLEGEDILITCRTNNPDGSFSHLRSSFSFADADNGGIINDQRPQTDRDYSRTVGEAFLPIIGHETGQFQSYPDYSQISKYTGVLYPYNLEVFRKRLKDAGMEHQQSAFAAASTAFALECYKEDIEYYFRTKGIGGFEMLDLQDYPGQGTALVGILDAFMDEKPGVDSEWFRGFCSELVPLARFKDFCFRSCDMLDIKFAIANYTENVWDKDLKWSITDGKYWAKEGSVSTSISQGEVEDCGDISISLDGLKEAGELTVTLSTGKYSNSWHIWVYPETSNDIEFVSVLDDAALRNLEEGGKMLFCPSGEWLKNTIEGLFTPDYWNYSMFKGICEGNAKPISPGTLCVLTDADNPLFKSFPTSGHSDWQWWSICRNSRPAILDKLKDYTPLIQVIDNVERCHKLGLLFEFKVGKGSLLVSMCDFAAIKGSPEGDAFIRSVADYFDSDSFNPQYSISADVLVSLFTSKAEESDAASVDTAADYSLSADK